MNPNTLQGLATLIAALAAAIVSVIAAWRGQQTDQHVTNLHASVTALAAGMAPKPAAAAPPGGNSLAEIERWLAFFRSFFGGRFPGSTADTPGFSFFDIFRYYDLVEEVLGELKAAGRLAVGATLPVPPIKVDIDGRSYTWDEKGITRNL